MLFPLAIFLTIVAFTTASPLIANTTTSSSIVVTSTETYPTSTATPTKCVGGNFNSPWILRDVTIFTPADQPTNTTNHGAVSFHFTDPNEDLHLSTDCSGVVTDDSCQGQDGGYVLCDNSTVGFKLAGSLLMLARGYIDDCLGPWPYNAGEAFGQNSTTFDNTSQPGGSLAHQEELLVHITELA